MWVFRENRFQEQGKGVGSHDDWIRDVAWCNNIGLLHDTIASCSEDQKVKIWRKEDPNKDEWTSKEINFEYPVWKVSWSQVGNMLAASGGDNQVTILKENSSGEWEVVSKVNEEGILSEV